MLCIFCLKFLLGLDAHVIKESSKAEKYAFSRADRIVSSRD